MGRHTLGEPGLLWKSHVSEGRLDEQELPCQQLLSLSWVPQRGTRVPAAAPAETLALADCAPFQIHSQLLGGEGEECTPL